MEDQVILVDHHDRETGLMYKTEAHQKAKLHRAVSVCIFTTDGQWLLQRRARSKYHSPGLWTNTSCTHPLPGETTPDAALRRLKQEMGLQCTLQKVFSFVYHEKLDNELSEHEFDHVFIGETNQLPAPNPDEVDGYRYMGFAELDTDIREHPERYTVWFRKIYHQVHDHYIKQKAL